MPAFSLVFGNVPLSAHCCPLPAWRLNQSLGAVPTRELAFNGVYLNSTLVRVTTRNYGCGFGSSACGTRGNPTQVGQVFS